MKPVAGFPSRTAFVVTHFRLGNTAEQIAERLEAATGETITPKMVIDLEASHQRAEHRKIRKAAQTLLTVCDGDAIDMLAYWSGANVSRTADALQRIAKEWPNA